VRVRPAGSEVRRLLKTNPGRPPRGSIVGQFGCGRFRAGKGAVGGAYSGDGKMTVLALVIAIIVLAAVYLLMRRKRS
jgi:hypothetical protein